MTDSWHNTDTELDAEGHADDFWSRHRRELQSGEFWADRIRELRGEPVKRLALALGNMPLPASFREAAIATRALIREKRKQNVDYDEELALLYWLAAINSFSIPYSKVLREPGYNVIESIPGKKLKGLSFSYRSLGYEKLKLLNKTDIKWIIMRWGEPGGHTTLHEMHSDVWRDYEAKLKRKRERQDQELMGSIRKERADADLQSDSTGRKKSSNSTKWAAVMIVIALLLVVVIGSQ